MQNGSFLENPDYLKYREIFDSCTEYMGLEVVVFKNDSKETIFKTQVKSSKGNRDSLYFFLKTSAKERFTKYRTNSANLYMYSIFHHNYWEFRRFLKQVKQDQNSQMSILFSVEGSVFNRFYLHKDTNTIFLDIPKCASSSFRESQSFDEVILTNKEISSYRSIAIIREPIDRIVSGFLEIMKRKNNPEIFAYYSQAEYIEIFDGSSVFQSFETALDYAIEGKIKDSHFIPQSTFLFDKVSGDRFSIGKFYKFENISKAVEENTSTGTYSGMKNLNRTLFTDLKKDILNFIKDNERVNQKIKKYLEEDFILYSAAE